MPELFNYRAIRTEQQNHLKGNKNECLDCLYNLFTTFIHVANHLILGLVKFLAKPHQKGYDGQRYDYDPDKASGI